jgi:hypothetical protein
VAAGCTEEKNEEEQPPDEEPTEVPLGPPPPVSGTYHWYADLTPALSIAEDFAVAPDGRVAFTSSPVQAGTVAGVPFTHFGPGTKIPNYDLLVAVLDTTGKVAWLKTFATAEIEGATSVAFDDKGDLYVSGLFKDNVDGLDFGNGVSVGIGPGEISSFLVKLRGSDGTALWATAIQSDTSYVQPYCGYFNKEHAVRGGVGAIGCIFDAGAGTRHAKIVTKTGSTLVAPAGPNENAFAFAFNPSTGEPIGTYVLGGVDSFIRTLAITKTGGIVIGGQLQEGTATDSAGSAPLTLTAPSCFVTTLSADLKPTARRTFGGDATSECDLTGVAVAGADRVLVAGNASGNVNFGDGATSSGNFGFTMTLDVSLANIRAPERFANERVFAVATDAWGQSFVGVSTESAQLSLRYLKHDAAGERIYTSKKYTPDASASRTSLKALGLEVDKSGAPSVFGLLSGTLSLDDGPHGEGSNLHLFALRFAP